MEAQIGLNVASTLKENSLAFASFITEVSVLLYKEIYKSGVWQLLESCGRVLGEGKGKYRPVAQL